MPPERKEKEVDHTTPRPWRLEWGVDECGGRGTWTIIRDENDHGPYIHVRCEQDGRMIVRAVNIHEEMRDQLLEMACAFHDNGRHPGSVFDCGSDVCEQNMEIITRADGKVSYAKSQEGK